MKLFQLLIVSVLCCSHVEGLCQKTFDPIKDHVDTLTSSQDTSKKITTGTQSNLAVSDPGTPADKSKSSSFKVKNPIDNLKKKITNQAVNNNNGTVGTSNLAISDAGSPADKSTKNKRKTGSDYQDASKKTTESPETISPQ